ncbi:MAG: cation:dicarboxylase symporter family transporter [Deltaproteobacteria bacterium]
MMRKMVSSKILTDPKIIILGVVAGMLVGYFFKPVGAAVFPYGVIYVALLAMCILPMMTTAIISGLGHMLRSPETRGSFKKMILVYGLGLLVPSFWGILAAMLGRPGVGLDSQDLAALGQMVLSGEQSAANPASSLSLLSFIGSIIPHNIFAAFSQGRVISIVFISILFGLALGLIQSSKAEELLHQIRVAYDAFELIFTWIIYLLPIGMFCLLAGLMANLNPIVLQALLRYIVVFCLAAILLLILYHCLLWRLVGNGFFLPLQALKEPLFLGFVANNSLITIPVCLETLQKNLAVDKKITELVVPFGIIANRHGVVFLFAYTTVFLFQLYGIKLNMDNISVTSVATVLTGMAAEGHGAVMAPIFTDVLQEVLVPAVLAPVVLTMTFDIVGRLENLLTIYATSILAVWMGNSVSLSQEEAVTAETEVAAVRRAPPLRSAGGQ